MARALYLYSPTAPLDLELRVEEFKERFQTQLGDLFADDELSRHERLLDDLATLDVQPRLSELTLDDFASAEAARAELEPFFDRCQSVICLENLPFLENNPFQVSYLQGLLAHVGPVLVDQGGLTELTDSDEFLRAIARLRTMEELVVAVPSAAASRVAEPTLADLMLSDVYRELDRLEGQVALASMSERQQQIFGHLRSARPTATELLKLSRLNPKDFGDALEGLKFFLKRQV